MPYIKNSGAHAFPIQLPCAHIEYYGGLQKDIDAITECIRACRLTLNPAKCKYLIASRKRQSILPPGGCYWVIVCWNKFTASYRYLGILVTSTLTWKEHIKQICTKAKKLLECYTGNSPLGLTQTADLRCLSLTCIRPHLYPFQMDMLTRVEPRFDAFT